MKYKLTDKKLMHNYCSITIMSYHVCTHIKGNNFQVHKVYEDIRIRRLCFAHLGLRSKDLICTEWKDWNFI